MAASLLVKTESLYFPGDGVDPDADLAASAAEDVLLVTVRPDAVTFIQNGAAGAYGITVTPAQAALIGPKLAALKAEYLADGNGGSLELDPADDTRRVYIDEDTGRAGVASGTNADTWPIDVLELAAAAL